MLNQRYIIPSIRTFHIENRPRIKISLIDEKSNVEINRIFMPIESNVLKENKNEEKLLTNLDTSSSKIQQIMNIIDHQQAYKHKEYHSTSSFVPINFLNEQQSSFTKIPIEHLSINSNKTVTSSPIIQIEQSLSTPLSSQLIQDSIINDKQATNRIFNEKNSTHFLHPSKFITITPINSLQNKTSESIGVNSSSSSSSNHIRYYQIGSIFTSTSTFIMHQNEVIAHATASNPFLSDTIFIILIATLTVIILLFCLGLFCLCRRSTKRNISPSFDGSTYAGLNSHSYAIPIDDHHQQQQQASKPYITDILTSSIPPKSSINQTTMTNDPNRLIQPAVLDQTIKRKISMNNKKLKKKRVGFSCCCCNSKRTPLTTINARTR